MKALLVFIFTIGLFAHTSAQTFVKTQGAAIDVAISPKDGSVYVVGTSKNVFKYSTKTKIFRAFGKQSRNVKSIATHPNGSLYMVSTSKEVYIDVKGRWNKIPGIKTDEVDIDKNGNVRAMDLSGRLKNLFQGKWKEQTIINKNTAGFNQIIGQDSKTLFARFKDNKFKSFKSGKWQTLNGNPLKISMDDKTGDVYAVGRNKGIYKWNKSSKKWILIKGTRKDFKDVAVHNDEIWAVANDKSIYIYNKNKKPLEEKDYSGTYRVTFTRILGAKQKEYYGTIGVYLEAKTKSGSVSIKPKDKKTNRAWDVSKSTPLKNKREAVTFSRKQRVDENGNVGVSDGKITNNYVLDIDKIREFTLAGEAANKDAVFDIQSNVKSIHIPSVEVGGWRRVKIKIADLKLNYEYFTTYNHLGFKIEKL